MIAILSGCQTREPHTDQQGDELPSDSLVYDTGAKWMPDSESILFYTYRHDPKGAELYSVSLSDGSLSRLTDTYHNEWWSDPSSGGDVVFISSDFERSERFGGSDIFELNLATDSLRRVSAPAGDGVFNIKPHFSPDGSHLLYSADYIGPKENAEIVVIDLESGEEKNLTDSPAIDRSGKWNSYGDTILFSSDRNGSFDLFTMSSDGSNLQQVSSASGNETDPDWAPDGDRVVYVSDESGVHQLYVLEVETGLSKRLTNSDGRDVLPAWSPDGAWIAFTSYRHGEGDKGDIYIIRPDGSDERRMTPR